MTSHLIPTAITDKNGKQTTVRKKPMAMSSGSKTLAGIAPTLGGKPHARKSARAFQPTKKQSEVVTRLPRIYFDSIDPQLTDLIRASSNKPLHTHWDAHVRISDVEGFSVLAAINKSSNATALMGLGKTTPEQALEFLQDKGLEHLAEDRSELINEVMARRIPLGSFTKYEAMFGQQEGEDTYLDAIEVYANKTLSVEHGFYLGVRDGTISLKDIKEVGITNISKTDDPYSIPDYLKAIKAGTANYTAQQLGSILAATKGSSTNAYTMLRMMKRYGGDVAASINDPSQVILIQKWCAKDGLDKDETQKAVIYADTVSSQKYVHHSKLYELYRAGVDPDFVVEKLKENRELDVREIIGLHAGTASAVLDGWL